jgi:hypothetical protein
MWAGANPACPAEFSIPYFLEDRGFIRDSMRGYVRRPNVGLWVVFEKTGEVAAPPELLPPAPRPRNLPSFRPMQ